MNSLVKVQSRMEMLHWYLDSEDLDLLHRVLSQIFMYGIVKGIQILVFLSEAFEWNVVGHADMLKWPPVDTH